MFIQIEPCAHKSSLTKTLRQNSIVQHHSFVVQLGSNKELETLIKFYQPKLTIGYLVQIQEEYYSPPYFLIFPWKWWMLHHCICWEGIGLDRSETCNCNIKRFKNSQKNKKAYQNSYLSSMSTLAFGKHLFIQSVIKTVFL